MSLLLLYSVSERTQCRPLRFLGRHYLHYQLSPLRSLLLKLVIAAYGDYRLRAAQYLLWKLGGTLMLSFVSPVLTLKVLFPFLVLFLGTNPTPIFIVIDCYPLWTTIHNIYSSFVSEFCELSVYKFLGCYLPVTFVTVLMNRTIEAALALALTQVFLNTVHIEFESI